MSSIRKGNRRAKRRWWYYVTGSHRWVLLTRRQAKVRGLI
jgi:hypothetical protein